MASVREELTCPICLSIYTDPVSLNTAEKFQTTEPVNETEVFCTYCIHSPVPATKSCLLCEASLCDAHLIVHSKSENHVLTEPTTSWGNRKYSIPKELLNEASEKKKERLRDVLQKLTTKREKTEKRVQSLQKHRRGVQEKAAGVTERLTALIRDIRKQLEDLEKRLLSDITQQQEQVLLPISELIQQLEKEKDELTRKMSHIEDLCNMTDPLTVLQEQESHRDDFCGAEKGDNEVTQRGDKQVPAGGDLDEDLNSVTLYRGLVDIVTDVKRGIFMQVTSDILLDINTANNNVIVSDDLKSVSFSRINQKRPEIPERFTFYSQVLSTRSFSSGRHYWEVQISESGVWRVGICYPSIGRSGDESGIGNNNKSWCLYSGNKHLSVTHNKIDTSLHHTSLHHYLSCDRVGILLDYEAGRLTFYELCDPIRHLYTFTVTFTEPLHAAFWVYGACVRILR
ncbi:E3 ubiquitin-protein ligase TRIM39-like [Bombina bombina]|uniref:E3 ubiquitin-protein ligase TRIM39-like n=1 Tax=Bombina bombina TaxID=8345 RepID=UPI00235A603D|nr:E3 ubiquitin-protein ligase TRIM39-like [Bombina bombina]